MSVARIEWLVRALADALVCRTTPAFWRFGASQRTEIAKAPAGWRTPRPVGGGEARAEPRIDLHLPSLACFP